MQVLVGEIHTMVGICSKLLQKKILPRVHEGARGGGECHLARTLGEGAWTFLRLSLHPSGALGSVCVRETSIAPPHPLAWLC